MDEKQTAALREGFEKYARDNDFEPDGASEAIAWGIWLACYQHLGQQWQPIETAPKECKTMFVAIGVWPDRKYTTDPYCVWHERNHGFVRWPHPRPPTHWMPLPAAPAALDTQKEKQQC
ncbi:MAG: hypothetical protein I4O48_17655 [Ralstonia sp.]|nr:hypothetical protein [Ralstonia sp.]